MATRYLKKCPISLAMRKLNQNYIAVVSLQSEQLLLLKEITKPNPAMSTKGDVNKDHEGKKRPVIVFRISMQ